MPAFSVDAAGFLTATTIDASVLTGIVPLSSLSGITTLQLDPAAGILGSQLDASAGILGSQLDAAAGIVSGQIVSVDAATITGIVAQANGGTGLDTSGALDGQVLIGKTSDGSLNLATLSAGAGIAITNGPGSVSIAATGSSGTVTSVGLVLPAELSVTVSPITTSGDLTAVWATESANTLLAGPATGVAATPGFRALVPADIPALAYVSSVALSLPAELTVGGSPVTSSGTLSATWASETQNYVFAAPSASSGTPLFRALVAGDVPNLNTSKLTAGLLAQARGGTNLDTSGVTDGQLLIGQSSDHTFGLATLTAGSGVSLVNAGHSITISATGGGGSVTSVGLSLPAELTVSHSPVTGADTLTAVWANESANTVFSGPSTGSAATPSFRALSCPDMPDYIITDYTGSVLVDITTGNLITVGC